MIFARADSWCATLMGTLLVHHPLCRGQFVTIQKEVADRLGAGPGTKDYGALAIVVQALAEVRRVADLPPSCFWPQRTRLAWSWGWAVPPP